MKSSSIDRRDVGAVGRTGRLELAFSERCGSTIVSHAYAEPPFRAIQPFRDGTGLHVMLTTSGPGIFGGDDLELRITVGSGARVRFTSQSSLQVHPSARPADASARLRCVYDVGEGAALCCDWDTMIPFAGSSLDQRIAITLAPRAALYWSDAFMAGREARGERWAFESLNHELRIVRAGRLEYLERYRLQQEAPAVRCAWTAGEACYFGTIIGSGSHIGPGDGETLHEALQQIEGVGGAADMLESQLLLARLTASRGVPFHAARAMARERLAGGLRIDS